MNKYAFINGRVLDGSEDMHAAEGLMILVEGENILSVEACDESKLSGFRVIDLAGRYIMPGLVNLHVHIPADGNPKEKASDAKKKVRLITSNPITRALGKKMCAGYAKTQLMSGTTTIRAVGGILDWDAAVRDRINAGKADGPRILAANMAVSVPGGHMAGSLAYEATSAEEAAGYVRKISETKPDLIKLMVTGGVLDATVKGEPGVLKMPEEYVAAACEEAHRLGLKVAAHVESPEGVKVALRSGVDTIEHGAKADEEMLSLFKEHNAALVATLSPALPFALFDRSVSNATELSQYNGTVVFEGIIDCAKKCLEAGVSVGLGTDTGCDFVTHYNTWMELQLFHKYCGVSNAFALYTGTKKNAEIAGIGDVTGSIEPGKCADMIVTAKNPLDDLSALADVELVMARGRLYEHPKVKKIEKVEREMGKFVR